MDDPFVRAHLLAVSRQLARPGDPPARRVALARLRAYALAARFPRPAAPVVAPERRVAPPRCFQAPGARAPLFVDETGTPCAVGHLVAADAPGLVERLRRVHNGAFLLEMEDALDALAAWGSAHGFSLPELAWVQPSYCYEVPDCSTLADWVEASYEAGEACGPVDVVRSAGGSVAAMPFCQDPGGPVQVWMWVSNQGSEAATGVTLVLGAGKTGEGEVLARSEATTVPPGEQLRVGPATVSDISLLNGDGWAMVEAPGSCGEPPVVENYWTIDNGGPGWMAQGECDSDTGGGPAVRPEEDCGCAAPGRGVAATGALALLAAVLLRRR